MPPWGAVEPNSSHQLWSRWRFCVYGKPVPLAEVELNVARWLRKGFGSVGRARVRERVIAGLPVVVIEAEVEGAPAHDPGYVESVRMAFAGFVRQGWGVTGLSTTKATVLAGDVQDGRPRSQLVVMPGIPLV